MSIWTVVPFSNSINPYITPILTKQAHENSRVKSQVIRVYHQIFSISIIYSLPHTYLLFSISFGKSNRLNI